MRSKTSNRAGIRRTQRKNERSISKALQSWIRKAGKEIISALSPKLKKAVDVAAWDKMEETGMSIIGPAYLDTLNSGKQQALLNLELKRSFDVLAPETVSAARALTAELVTNITEETRKIVAEKVAEGTIAGKSNEKIARELRTVVGLNERQVIAGNNFRDSLLQKHPDWSPDRIDKKVATYNRKQLIYRTNNIARTESAKVQNQGYVDQLRNEGETEVEFTVFDPCPICEALDGKIYPVGEARGVIPVHPSCRCAFLPVTPS